MGDVIRSSWWNLESELAMLVEQRMQLQEALEQPQLLTEDQLKSFIRQVEVTDRELGEYVAQILAKVDNIHSLLQWARAMEDCAAAEVKLRQAAVKRFQVLQERVKAMALEVMAARDLKRATGSAGRYLLRKGNGGLEPLQVDGLDERGQLKLDAVLPAEYRDIVVRLPAQTWGLMVHAFGDEGTKIMAMVPNQERIREACGKPCPGCGGTGTLMRIVNGTPQQPVCLDCLGDGKARVPGARVLPRGEHIEVKG